MRNVLNYLLVSTKVLVDGLLVLPSIRCRHSISQRPSTGRRTREKPPNGIVRRIRSISCDTNSN